MEKGTYLQRCEAMVQQNIADPNSMDGIKFCVDGCPYEVCVVFEERHTSRQAKVNRAIAKGLHKFRVSSLDIALILNVSIYTVKRYIRNDNDS